MTNSTNGHDGLNGDEKMSEEKQPQPQLNMLTQYVKDVSFENPNAPHSLRNPGENPNIQLGINVDAKKIEEKTFEVSLEVTVDAKNDQGYIYKMEVVYAGLFMLKDIPDNVLQPVLFVDCPILIFPFLRHTVLKLSQEGGFPPLQLDPIDFGRLYRENVNKIKKEKEATIN